MSFIIWVKGSFICPVPHQALIASASGVANKAKMQNHSRIRRMGLMVKVSFAIAPPRDSGTYDFFCPSSGMFFLTRLSYWLYYIVFLFFSLRTFNVEGKKMCTTIGFSAEACKKALLACFTHSAGLGS